MTKSYLDNATAKELKKQGFCKWSDEKKDGKHLWLFPADEYDNIPNNYPVVTISFETEKFQKGKSDNDRRFGMLSFGVLK